MKKLGTARLFDWQRMAPWTCGYRRGRSQLSLSIVHSTAEKKWICLAVTSQRRKSLAAALRAIA